MPRPYRYHQYTTGAPHTATCSPRRIYGIIIEYNGGEGPRCFTRPLPPPGKEVRGMKKFLTWLTMVALFVVLVVGGTVGFLYSRTTAAPCPRCPAFGRCENAPFPYFGHADMRFFSFFTIFGRNEAARGARSQREKLRFSFAPALAFRYFCAVNPETPNC